MTFLGRKSNVKLLFRHPCVFARFHRWALAVLLTGATLDAVTTIAFVRKYGWVEEFHPAVRLVIYLLDGYPVLSVVLAKLAQVAAAVLVGSLFRGWCKGLMIAAGILYGLAGVVNHFGWVRYLYELFPGLL